MEIFAEVKANRDEDTSVLIVIHKANRIAT